MQKEGVGLYRALGWRGDGRSWDAREWNSRSRWQDIEELSTKKQRQQAGTGTVVEVPAVEASSECAKATVGAPGTGQDRLVPTSNSGVKPTKRRQGRATGELKTTAKTVSRVADLEGTTAQQQSRDMLASAWARRPRWIRHRASAGDRVSV